MSFNDKLTNLIVLCPHCQELILIEQLNCRIFRHGMFKDSGKQMDPHTPKEVCDELTNDNKIYGCGKPFKINVVDGTYIPEVCDY